MDLKDSTLMFLSESAAFPAVASIARTAYGQLAAGEEVESPAPGSPDDPLTAPVWPHR
jgi:hypothetical protein